jgi:hypothetical protein
MTLVTSFSICGVTPSLAGSTSSPCLIASHKWLTTVVVFSPRKEATSSYSDLKKYNIQLYNSTTDAVSLCNENHVKWMKMHASLVNMLFRDISFSVVEEHQVFYWTQRCTHVRDYDKCFQHVQTCRPEDMILCPMFIYQRNYARRSVIEWCEELGKCIKFIHYLVC